MNLLGYFAGQNSEKLCFVAVHLRVLARTDSGVHTFKQRTEDTYVIIIITEAGQTGRVPHIPHRTTTAGLGATSPAATQTSVWH